MTTTAQRQATKLTDAGLELVEHQGDIPPFRSEAEEAAYWETHTLGDGLLEQMKPAREVDPRLPAPRAASTWGGIKVRATKCKVGAVRLDGESRHDPVIRQLRLTDR